MAVNTSVGDTIMARLEFYDGESVAYNVLHYKLDSITDDNTGLPVAVTIPWADWGYAFAQEVYGALFTTWQALASEEVTFTGVTVQDILPVPRSTPFTFMPENPTTGNVAGEAMPLQDTPTFLKRTQFGERWGLGRFFFAGISEASQEKGRLMPAWLANAPAFGNALAASIGVQNDGYTFELIPVLLGTSEEDLNFMTPIIAVQLSNNVIKTQRRRRPGKGI